MRGSPILGMFYFSPRQASGFMICWMNWISFVNWILWFSFFPRPPKLRCFRKKIGRNSYFLDPQTTNLNHNKSTYSLIWANWARFMQGRAGANGGHMADSHGFNCFWIKIIRAWEAVGNFQNSSKICRLKPELCKGPQWWLKKCC